MDFKSRGVGKFNSEVKVGDLTVVFPMWVTSQEHNIGIFSSSCTKCLVGLKQWSVKDKTRVAQKQEGKEHSEIGQIYVNKDRGMTLHQNTFFGYFE